MKKNDWILIISVILYSWMFYQQTPGLNFLIFSVALIGLLIWRNPIILKDSSWYVAASGTLVSGICVALFGTAVAVVANVVSLSLLSAYSISRKSSVILAGIYSLYSFASSIGFMIADLVRRKNGTAKTKGSRFWIRLGIGAGILVIVIVFFVLYQKSNPLFLDLTRKIKLDFISWPWVRLTFLGFVLLYGFFYHRNFPAWLRWDVARPSALSQETVQSRENRIFGRSVNIKWEIGSAVILLALLNLLLLVVNGLDIYYLWITQGLPSGMTYADSVHQGTGNLIASMVIAILIILFFFRGHVNFAEKNNVIKTLAIIWILQNIIVLISTGYRNFQYISEYSLTYRRIGIYIWLVLTLVGLLTTFIKISGKKSNWYLFKANGWAFYIVLVLFACQNWDLVITKFNIQKSKTLDKYYLLSLGSSAVIPELLALPPEKSDIPTDISPAYYDDYYSSRKSWDESNYPYYRADFNEELNRRMYSFLVEYENSGWRSWNSQDEETAKKIYDLSKTGVFNTLSLKNMGLDSLTYIQVFNQIQELDLSGNHISKFKDLTVFSKLKSLNLGTNNIYTTVDFPVFPNLEKLWLNNNQISDFKGLSRQPKLEFLCLSQNSGSVDLAELSKIKTLKELDLGSSRVEDYTALKDFPELRSLSIGGQQNTDFSKFPVLPKLEEIDLSNNAFGTTRAGLMTIFNNFTELRKINLGNNSISSLYVLTNYYGEYSSFNNLINMPAEIKPLFMKLEDLNVSSNTISDLEAITYFKNIKKLNVNGNSIVDISPLAKLKNLETLDLSNNQIVSIDSLKFLTQIKELNITGNQVIDISVVKYMTNLENFSAASCPISDPKPLSTLTKLRILQLSNCYFTDLSFLKNMKSIEVLYLNGSSVQDFSPLYGLENLKVLYLDQYLDNKYKRELKEHLPGVNIIYSYYNSYEYGDNYRD
jgi:Leucine-rich repeat (LRR) protein